MKGCKAEGGYRSGGVQRGGGLHRGARKDMELAAVITINNK